MRDEILDELIEEQVEKRHIGAWFSPRWGRVMLVVLLCLALGAAYIAYSAAVYHRYEVQSKKKWTSSDSTSYRSLEGKLFSYSRDGASYAGFEGNVIWNESFDMENPACDICGGYALVYDRDSTSAYIFNTSGLAGSLSMTLPILRASVAANGDVVMLMQSGEKAYLRMYNPRGNLLASGEVHAKNTGYPIAMAVSQDAKRLLVSLLDLNDGDVKTTLCFYDFSDASDDESNHIAANFSYADQVIPEVAFLKGGAVAFGDEELIFFSVGDEIGVKKEVFLHDPVKMVMHSSDKVAVVTTRKKAKKKGDGMLRVYGPTGSERFIDSIRGNLTYADFMSNGELLLHNGKNIRILKDDGALKFAGRAEDPVRAVFPWDGQRNYYFITKDQIQKVVLR